MLEALEGKKKLEEHASRLVRDGTSMKRALEDEQDKVRRLEESLRCKDDLERRAISTLAELQALSEEKQRLNHQVLNEH
ncbi:hypothetical protein BSKO_04953 [Bryopsis sp. KO-2023]|nr:hypothetical protein BSKO_04953 [Bryopsis sp. KO-2023]